MAAVDVEFEERRLNKAIAEFIGLSDELVEVVARKLAFDALYETTTAIGGLYGLPKRIDTGRYRAGWRLAGREAKLGALPGDVSAASEIGDGEAKVTRTKLVMEMELTNNVEYGEYLEYGTLYLQPPGLHLTRGVTVTRFKFLKSLGVFAKDVNDAWEARKRAIHREGV